MSVDVNAALPVALQAIKLASAIVHKKPVGNVVAKGDRDMASDVDYAVENTLRDFLAQETPEIGFLGEENGATGTADVVWTLDPVDGTANFVRDVPLCGISLALMENSHPILGVIDLPFLGERYHAAQGLGARHSDTQIRASRTTHLADAIVSIGDYAVGKDAAHKNQKRFALTEQLADRVQRVRMFGSAAIDLAWVAAGRIDACIMLSNNPWDVAAGVVIAREAGVNVIGLDEEQHSFTSAATIAVTPAISHDLSTLVREAVSAG